MTEPDVTLTDYALAVESGIFAWLIGRGRGAGRPLAGWFSVFFGAAAAAALTGGTVHGFFLDARTLGARLLWPASLLAIGVSALAAWAIGARLAFPGRVARAVTLVAGVAWLAYAALVLSGRQAFLIAVLDYLPAATFLLLVFAREHGRTRAPALLAGTLGLLAMFVASGLQQAGIALHPVYMNHNALYHLIQAGALLLVFTAGRWLVAAEAGEGRGRC